MQESKITAKGQTTFPRAIRQALGLKPGDKVRYVILDNGEVRLVRSRLLSELAGMLARPGQRRRSLQEIEDAIAAGATRGRD